MPPAVLPFSEPTLSEPTEVTARLEGTSGAEVAWQASRAVGCELERYEVQQRAVGAAGSSGGGGWSVCASGAAVQGQLSCRVGGLAAITTYEFRVVAHEMGGAVPSAESEASSTLQIPGVLRRIALDAYDRPGTHHTLTVVPGWGGAPMGRLLHTISADVNESL